jgi:hypothetical protein
MSPYIHYDTVTLYIYNTSSFENLSNPAAYLRRTYCDRQKGISYVYFMFITCLLHVYYMFIICILNVYYIIKQESIRHKKTLRARYIYRLLTDIRYMIK